jgi:hypothetical protein
MMVPEFLVLNQQLNMKINACFLLIKNTTKYLIAGKLINRQFLSIVEVCCVLRL